MEARVDEGRRTKDERRTTNDAGRWGNTPSSFALRLAGDESGAVAIIAAFMLLAMMGMLALTIDVGYAYGQRRMAQNVADSGAIAGAQIVAEKQLGAARTDTDVLNAIRDAAKNSTGGFVTQTSAGAYDPTRDFFTAVYVADASADGVPEEIIPEVRVGSAPGGVIPLNARGVRLTPKRFNPTFFAQVLGHQTLAAGARATALALDAVGFGEWAPYAIWAGEEEHQCFNIDNVPASRPKITLDGNFVYGCIPLYGGTRQTPVGGPVPRGPGGINRNCWFPPNPGLADGLGCEPTEVIYRSPAYQQRNVYNGDTSDAMGVTRWNQVSAAFKGFFHSSNQYLDVGSTATYDTGTGVAEGSSDLDQLYQCWAQNQPNPRNPSGSVKCLMVMPVINYKTGVGAVTLTVAGFSAVRLVNNPYDSTGGNDLRAELVQAVMPARNIRTGPCPQNGKPCLKVVRLVQ